MKKIDPMEAAKEIGRLKEERKMQRKIRKNPWPHLQKYTGEILALANAPGGSKYYVQMVLVRRYPETKDISPDQIYRYVKSIYGQWTKPRKKPVGEK